ncbi:MAG TPA: hypothetical protein VHK46_00050 [Gaiellaceae bacterium]|nr:hypothetical protein [Gaiellaceae bacterium]
MVPRDAPSQRGRRALGILVIVASALWTLLWGLLALVAWTLGGDTTGWVVASVALAFGVLAFVLGVSLVRGRPPSRMGWLVTAGASLAVFLLPVDSYLEDREAAPVNRAVARVYMERNGLNDVEADCDRLEDNSDGSQAWICDMGFAADYDVCEARVRRKDELLATDIDFCLSDEE